MADNENKTAGIHAIIFWICVICTIALMVAGGWFYLKFLAYKNDIVGRVVVIESQDAPGPDTPAKEVRAWLDELAPVFPGCKCSLGKPAEGNPGELLFCVGFNSGDSACRLENEKLPDDVKIFVSKETDPGDYIKMIFLIDYFTGMDVIFPRTDRSFDVTP